MSKLAGAICAAALMLGGGAAWGQEAADETAESALSIEASVSVPSAYVFRGYVIDDDHLLVQPEVVLGYELEAGGLTLSPYIGAWANLTDASAEGDPEWFDELDLYAGADIDLTNGFTLGVIYTYYLSPADNFDDIHEIGLTLSHENFLSPAAGVYREIDNRGGDENTYIELSVTPGFDVSQVEGLRIDFPVIVGLSPDEYYTDDDGDGEWLGYAQGGVRAIFPLGDSFSITGGVDYIQLIADSTQASNDGDDYQVVGHVGVTFSR